MNADGRRWTRSMRWSKSRPFPCKGNVITTRLIDLLVTVKLENLIIYKSIFWARTLLHGKTLASEWTAGPKRREMVHILLLYVRYSVKSGLTDLARIFYSSQFVPRHKVERPTMTVSIRRLRSTRYRHWTSMMCTVAYACLYLVVHFIRIELT
jgi:hypothetical protein